ncbi:hypothetical protein D1867_05920 [Acidianus infernus]|uniref:Uncharacterized protein n=1 Tax=Acidianus infernus TaxID=12915 RepID=A0A6A9QDF0_ACIIN|nr:hypothetical protein [Acidianus infernus]MUM64789.1 hypothetical protein [Acidianus infernus]
MIAKDKISSLREELNNLSETNLSIAEQGILQFIKEQIDKEEELVSNFDKSTSENNYDKAVSDFFQLIQRTNLMYAYIMQPSVLSMLSNEKFSKIVQDLLDCISQIISDVVLTFKHNMKQFGLESVNVNITSNPPSISISLAIKNA